MLKQHREEAFDGAEQRAVDHHRTLVRAIGGDVFELETFRKVEVELDGGHLPGTSDGVTGLHGDLRTVEGCAARIVDQVQTGFLGDLGQRVGGFLPNLVGTDVLVRILGGQLPDRSHPDRSTFNRPSTKVSRLLSSSFICSRVQ